MVKSGFPAQNSSNYAYQDSLFMLVMQDFPHLLINLPVSYSAILLFLVSNSA